MAINRPDIDNGGVNQPNLPGNPGSPNTPSAPATPGNIVASVTQPGSTIKVLQTRWRPESFLNFHGLLVSNPMQASRSLDQAIQISYSNSAQLESMIACRQTGSKTVTGSAKNINTGLAVVQEVNVSIDNGSTAHNFWVSGNVSQLPGCIDIYVWQPTAAGNNTPIACTTAVVVRWAATGTLP